MQIEADDDDDFSDRKIKTPEISFPKDLAEVVYSRWKNLVSGSYKAPDCPPKKLLQELLEIVYLTASAPEEARLPQFNVVAVPAGGGDQEIGHKWPFTTPRPFSVSEMRRLVPAVDVRKSAVWLEWSATKWEVKGLVDLGTSWFRARMGLEYIYRDASCLLVEVDRPGRMKVYQGTFHVGTLTDGRIERVDGIEFPSLSLGPVAEMGLRALRKEIIEPKIEDPKEYFGFEYVALWNTYAGIANSISLSGHGGALVIVPPRARILNKNIKIKYPQMSGVLRSSFVDFINARHLEGDVTARRENGEVVSHDEMVLAELGWRDKYVELVESTRFVARLAGCDGAIVISADLNLLGFGAEIKASMKRGVVVSEVADRFALKYRDLDVEEFGMRHRSACKLISQEPSFSILVISQDGPVSAVWSKEKQVLVKRGLNLVNMNMIWA